MPTYKGQFKGKTGKIVPKGTGKPTGFKGKIVPKRPTKGTVPPSRGARARYA